MQTHPLAAWLQEHQRTQKWLARQLGVREATVSGWVNGTTPRPEMMARVSDLTGLPVTIWFTRGQAA